MKYGVFGTIQNDDGTPIDNPLAGTFPDQANETISSQLINGGQSSNFKTGSSGWQITDDGNAEFNSINARGTITGGTITGAIITGGTINGTDITTDNITDSTYGLNGVFVKTLKITNFSSAETDINITPNNGGILTIICNYTAGSGTTYRQLPGFNVSNFKEYFQVVNTSGYYQLNHLGQNIKADIPTIIACYYSIFFNSLESGTSFPN